MDDVQGQSDESAAPSVGVQTESIDHIICEKCHIEIDLTDLEAFTKIECPNCGKQTTVPARLGSFLLLELLGMGGMGGVYVARDETLGRLVAIKVMLESLGDDEAFISSFRNEAQAIAKLNHPNITQIYSFGQERGQPYIVMELVRGERLDDIMDKATEPLDQGFIMLMALEVSEGLGAADDAGIIHGDIKPENILFDDKQRAKLVDFGLASSVQGSNQDNAIWGTPYYIAPEKIRRHKPDARSDIYSLGATLYHILTGHPPFEGETPIEVVKARLEMPPPPMKEYREDIHEQVERVIMRCLEVEPTRRYPNYKSLISDLRKVVDEIGVHRPTNTRKRKNIRIAKKRTTSSVGSATVSSTGEIIPEKSGKGNRIIIKRRSGAVLRRPSPTGASREAAGERPAEKPEPTPEELAAAQAHRKAQRKAALLMTLIMYLIWGVGGIGLTMMLKAGQRAEARRIWIEMGKLRTTASNSYEEATGIYSQFKEWTAACEPLAMEARLAAQAVTGNELSLPEPPPPAPVVAVVEEAAATSAVIAGTNAAAAADGGTAAATTEPADRPDAEPTAADAAEESGEVDEVVAEAIPDVPLEPIEKAALACMEAEAELRELMREVYANLDAMLIARNHALQSALPEEAQPYQATIEELLVPIANAARQGKLLAQTCRSQHAAAIKIKTRVDTEQGRQQALQAEREAAARKLEEERLRQESQARLVEAEKGIVEGLREQMTVHMHAHNFAAAVKELERQMDGFRTEPGKDALQVLLDGYQAVVKMQSTLMALITAEPVPWGVGSGDAARDALKADARGIYIRGQIKPIPWNELKTADLLKLVDHFVIRSRNTRASDKMRLAIGAAIYCDSFGEAGQAKAADYVGRAITLGTREADIERLLPGLL